MDLTFPIILFAAFGGWAFLTVIGSERARRYQPPAPAKPSTPAPQQPPEVIVALSKKAPAKRPTTRPAASAANK